MESSVSKGWDVANIAIVPQSSEEEEHVRKSLQNKIRQLKALCEDNRFGRYGLCVDEGGNKQWLTASIFDRDQTWADNIKELERTSQIRDKRLLADCAAVMLVVVVFFFIHSSVSSIHLNLGWIAILGTRVA